MPLFSDEELQKAKELRDKKLIDRSGLSPSVGSFVFSKSPLTMTVALENDFHVIVRIVDATSVEDHGLWLPTLDEALHIARQLKISFAQITDYIHRKRYADGRERLGVYQLLIESLR